MGWISDLRRLAELSVVDSARTPIRSPWSGSTLTRIVLSDVAGVTTRNPGRAEAMRVPAIVRGRALIAGLLARHPLIAQDAAGVELAQQPAWLTTTATAQSPRLRALWTFDDLIFGGLSLWAVDRDDTGSILDAVRVPAGLWTIDPAAAVQVDGKHVSAEQVILFEGPQEGLVTIGAGTIQAALDMEAAWAKRVRQPVPMLELHSTDSTEDLDDDEADELVDTWEKARRDGGGTAYTPSSIETKVHGVTAADLFVSGRNALRLDLANLMALPAALLEGSMSTASLTYSTTEGSRSDLVDLSLGYWAMPYEARLSQDDVTPAGTNIAINLAHLNTPTQPATASPAQED